MSRYRVQIPGMPSFEVGADEIIRFGTLSPQAIQRFGEKLQHEFNSGGTPDELNALAARLLAPPPDRKPTGPASTGPEVRAAVAELQSSITTDAVPVEGVEQALSAEVEHGCKRVRSRR